MAKNPETQALLETALRHVLEAQRKILAHPDAGLFLEGALKLAELAGDTWELIAQGCHKIGQTKNLTALAKECEKVIDDISEKHWKLMDVSITAVYDRVEETFRIQPVQEQLKLKAALDVRNHFHNQRVALLGQLLNTRTLINNGDYGSELQKIWQQLLQKQLGPDFKVLEGGHIIDYSGNNANAQIDLIVVPADAQVLTPSNLEGGRANVLCDQVIAAIMVTSVLKTGKLREDWTKLQRVSELFKFTDEFPNGKSQAWPLCYIVAGQSVPLAKLKETWIKLVEESPSSSFVPQFVTSLDAGYLYSGATAWPRPRFPANYVERVQVYGEDGIWSGLGLAWILTQIRARHALMRGQPVRSVQRFSRLLDNATLKSVTPPTWSDRFSALFKSYPILGILRWGRRSLFPHNRLHMISLEQESSDADLGKNNCYYQSEYDPLHSPTDDSWRFLRWFRHGVSWNVGSLVALEEWKPSENGSVPYEKSYAVFDSISGAEIHLTEPLPDSPDLIETALITIRDSRVALDVGPGPTE